MARHQLTKQQLAAVVARSPRTFVEAGPGTGKTTVAAERFGVLRSRLPARLDKGVVGLSFTVTATNELRERITDRWGPSVLAGHSRVRTIDAELTSVLCHMLRSGAIAWPGGLIDIRPVDSLDGHPAWKFNKDGRFESYCPDLNGNCVEPTPLHDQMFRISKTDMGALLEDGVCTHDDVRRILASAWENPDLRRLVIDHRRNTVAHLIVDEVFDANELDINFLMLHCEAGIPTTVVGDHWQALYEFRDALPDEVSAVLAEDGPFGFERAEIDQSFRFKNNTLRDLALNLRSQPCAVPELGPDARVEVAIGLRWRRLWEGPAWVLPLSFGRIKDQTDAAIALLLDHVVQRTFDIAMRSRHEAFVRLRLTADPDSTWPDTFDEIVQLLSNTEVSTATAALDVLRSHGPTLGTSQKVRARNDDDRENNAVVKLQQLAARLHADRPLVPGMTSHQAKGQQWGSVGLCLRDDDHEAVVSGLDLNNKDHRAIYVAMTRGTDLLGRID